MCTDKSTNPLSRNFFAFGLLTVGLFLSGCTAQEMALEEKYQPYAGSDRYPIKVAHGKAHVKPCGDWSDDSTYKPLNDNLENHGCAVQSNIAAMVSDPTDFVKPGKMPPVNSTLRTSAFTNANTGQAASSSDPVASASNSSGSGGTP
jgi:type IV pilus biogenesis protein CpaD/CtpE